MALLENTVAAVTPSDTVDLPAGGQLYIGSVAGGTDLKITAGDGGTVTFKGVTVGWLGVLKVVKVFDTGTDVTEILVAH